MIRGARKRAFSAMSSDLLRPWFARTPGDNEELSTLIQRTMLAFHSFTEETTSRLRPEKIKRIFQVASTGLRPEQRAEATLRMILGQQTYTLLERQGFLDVLSVHYADRQRVYRLRRDPNHLRERWVRVIERGHYVADQCIVRRNPDDCRG